MLVGRKIVVTPVAAATVAVASAAAPVASKRKLKKLEPSPPIESISDTIEDSDEAIAAVARAKQADAAELKLAMQRRLAALNEASRAKKSQTQTTTYYDDDDATEEQRFDDASTATTTTKTSAPMRILDLVGDDDDDDDDSHARKKARTARPPLERKEMPVAAATTVLASAALQQMPVVPVPKPVPVARTTSNAWLGVVTLARETGIHSVTCVDPGTRNLAVMRMQFYPSIRITHAHVLDTRQLCDALDMRNPLFRMRSNPGVIDRTSRETVAKSQPKYTMHAIMYAIFEFVKRTAVPGCNGPFDSDMLLVEEQSFDRLMARVESTITSAYLGARGSRSLIEVLCETEGGTVSAAQTIAATSVKTCYTDLFPLLTKEEEKKMKEEKEKKKKKKAQEKKKPVDGDEDDSSGDEEHGAPPPPQQSDSEKWRKKPHGVGDSHNGISEAQRQFNKFNATKFGSMIVPQHMFGEVVPRANFTADDERRMRASKMDDLYDTLFMCGYFVSTYLHDFAKRKKRGISKPLPAHYTPAQRDPRRYEELFEFVSALCVQTPMEKKYAMNTLAQAIWKDKAPVFGK